MKRSESDLDLLFGAIVVAVLLFVTGWESAIVVREEEIRTEIEREGWVRVNVREGEEIVCQPKSCMGDDCPKVHVR
jgi:hypothetical protein